MTKGKGKRRQYIHKVMRLGENRWETQWAEIRGYETKEVKFNKRNGRENKLGDSLH